MASIVEQIMTASTTGDDLEALLARLTVSRPSEPCHTLLPQLQPSVDTILATLSPADAEVFRSVLDGVTLIPHTPPFAKPPPPFPVDELPSPEVLLAASSASMRAKNLPRIREKPLLLFAYLSEPSPVKGTPLEPTADDLRFAARVALRLDTGELDDKMRLARMTAECSWTVFAPLVAFRHASAGALAPLIDLGPPLACALGEYAWTWRTCAKCAHHTGRGKCGMFCADAPWFVELWRELVAILRARPDPDAVLIWGKEHFSRALQKAMACPICVNVAEEHLKCFKGLLVVEAAKRIAEIPLKI